MAFRRSRFAKARYSYPQIKIRLDNEGNVVQEKIQGKAYFMVIDLDHYNRYFYSNRNYIETTFTKLNQAIEYAQSTLDEMSAVVLRIIFPGDDTIHRPVHVSHTTSGIMIFSVKDKFARYPYIKINRNITNRVCWINKKFIKKSTIERKRKIPDEKSKDDICGQT